MLKGYRLFIKDVKALVLPGCLLFLYYIITRLICKSTCAMILIIGIPCPGCGLTRAGELLLNLQFKRAWEMHPFIYPIILLCILYLIFRYVLGVSTKSLSYLLGVLLACMIIFYVYRMITMFPGEAPMNYTHGSIMEKIITWIK